jgi:tetratricopeptide (TPR) repeat protein
VGERAFHWGTWLDSPSSSASSLLRAAILFAVARKSPYGLSNKTSGRGEGQGRERVSSILLSFARQRVLDLDGREIHSARSRAATDWAGLHLGSFEQTVAWCRRAIEANRNYPRAYFELAAALAQLGRLDEAHSAVKAGLALNPAFTISRARAVFAAISDHPRYLAGHGPIFEGMRKAGVPEQ